MRKVRGEGYFGIVSALPPADRAGLAIKNGLTLHVNEGRWAVNCLAISNDWVLVVQTDYPAARGGLDHGGRTCTEVAARVLAPAAGPPGAAVPDPAAASAAVRLPNTANEVHTDALGGLGVVR